MFDVFDEGEPAQSRPPSSSCPPGPGLASLLLAEHSDAVDPTVDGIGSPAFHAAQFTSIEHSGSWERLAGWIQAHQWLETHAAVLRVHAAADADADADADAHTGQASGPLDDVDVAMRSLTSDLALAWRVADRTASRRIAQAVSLVEGLPLAIDALLAGRTSIAHVLALADVLLDYDDPELRRRLCEELLPTDDEPPGPRRRLRTPSALKRAARRSAMRLAPKAARKRAATARRERGVFLDATGDDGMATVTAYLPAEEALAMYRTVEAHARRVPPAAPPGPDAAAVAAAAGDGAAGDGAAGNGAAGDGRGADGAAADGPSAEDPQVEHRSADARRADSLVDLVAGGALLAAGVVPEDDTPSAVADQGSDDGGSVDTGDVDDLDDSALDPEPDGRGEWSPGVPARKGRTGRPRRSGGPRTEADRRRDRRRRRGDRPGPTRRRPRSSTTNVQIRVVIDADTLLGLNDMPAELVGYGPITADHARALAVRRDATWRRMITEPLSGTVLDIGRRRYRPPAAMADHVRANHPACAFPGCRVPAEACDLDHVIPYDPDDAHGITAVTNLLPGCRRHHLLKTLGGWICHAAGDDTITWTSPTGHRYRTRKTPLLGGVDRPATAQERSDAPGESSRPVCTEAGCTEGSSTIGDCDSSGCDEVLADRVAASVKDGGTAGEEPPF